MSKLWKRCTPRYGRLNMNETSQMPPFRGALTVVQIAGAVPEGGLWVGDLDLEGQEVIIGRLPSSDITLQGDSLISRRHARLFRQKNDYFVEDLGSSNGTYVIREWSFPQWALPLSRGRNDPRWLV
jgi:pSer/pThr/pTyr-binding forkhead associated (FHA) protein